MRISQPAFPVCVCAWTYVFTLFTERDRPVAVLRFQSFPLRRKQIYGSFIMNTGLWTSFHAWFPPCVGFPRLRGRSSPEPFLPCSQPLQICHRRRVRTNLPNLTLRLLVIHPRLLDVRSFVIPGRGSRYRVIATYTPPLSLFC